MKIQLAVLTSACCVAADRDLPREEQPAAYSLPK